MKIVRLTTFLDFGGVEKRLLNISSYDDKLNGIEHLFVAISRGGVVENGIRKNGKRVVCLNKPHRIPSLKALIAIFILLKREKPDVIHTSGAEANFHGIIAAWLSGVPVRIAEEIGMPKQSNVAKLVFRIVFKLSHAVVGNARQVLKYLACENRVSPGKQYLVHNPVLFPKLERRVNGGRFVFISVCRLFPIKNLNSVIKLLPDLLLTNPNLEYWIIGEGPIKEELTALVEELGLSECVKFLGFQENVTKYLLQADVFVLPSFSEGFSNALVEAMYAGVPCVATNIGGASEIITHGKNGFLIDPNNKESIYNVLHELLLLPEAELYKIGSVGKSHVESSYSLTSHMENLYFIYNNYRRNKGLIRANSSNQ